MEPPEPPCSGRPAVTIVVGYLPAKGGRACLDLAAELARSGLQEHIAVVTVATIEVFRVWSAVVLVWYFTYSIKHPHLGWHEHVGLIDDEPESASPDSERG